MTDPTITLSFVVGVEERLAAAIWIFLSVASISSFTSRKLISSKTPLILVSVFVSVITPVVVLYEPAETLLKVISA